MTPHRNSSEIVLKLFRSVEILQELAVKCQTETLEEKKKRNERKNFAQTAMNDGTNAIINAMV